MNRRAFLKHTAAGAAAAALSLRCGEYTKKPLNVLYICMEDQSPRLGCYGHPVVRSPHIDAFATKSVLLEDCHCQVALCTPSRTSILTGVRPQTSGMVKIDDNWQSMLPDAVSLPRHFRENGYYTLCVGKISDPRCGGMDEAWVRFEEEWGVTENAKPLAALQDRPFFLAIGYKQTHDPWTPSQQSLDLYDLEDVEPPGTGHTYKDKTLSDLELKKLIRRYYADITDVDRLIGELLDAAGQIDLYDHTIILVGAMDHGYSLGERGHWGKGNNADRETQVPPLIRVPGNPANGQRAAGLVDLYPTLIDLCALPGPPQQLQGYSLRGLLEQPNRDWKQAVFSVRAYYPDVECIKTQTHTFISLPDGRVELYDRVQDAKCPNNIASKYPDVVQHMQKLQTNGWQAALPKNA
ncbi:MAG: sulfatase-like hydrolase/transferase [candidate division KSB1 bacterium]|nr:sulfatase-like hydrolase/transferase [candidate division KSB1 bacterium]